MSDIDKRFLTDGGEAEGAQGGQGRGHEGPSIVDELQTPELLQYIKLTVGLFAVAGFGYGLTVLLTTSLMAGGQQASALFGAIGIFVGFFLAPVVALVTGSYVGVNSDDDPETTAVASLVGSAVGAIVMGLLLVIFGAIILSGGGGGTGGGGGSAADLLGPLFGAVLGVAVTGGLTTFVTMKLQAGDWF